MGIFSSAIRPSTDPRSPSDNNILLLIHLSVDVRDTTHDKLIPGIERSIVFPARLSTNDPAAFRNDVRAACVARIQSSQIAQRVQVDSWNEGEMAARIIWHGLEGSTMVENGTSDEFAAVIEMLECRGFQDHVSVKMAFRGRPNPEAKYRPASLRKKEKSTSAWDANRSTTSLTEKPHDLPSESGSYKDSARSSAQGPRPGETRGAQIGDKSEKAKQDTGTMTRKTRVGNWNRRSASFRISAASSRATDRDRGNNPLASWNAATRRNQTAGQEDKTTPAGPRPAEPQKNNRNKRNKNRGKQSSVGQD
ncbi:hypothetical protein NKR23_g9558 [Pleurostoma richardsiae]|uniref:Uncharacterized protein n=1 Tax=Pleurostoma richardsiae TaxID=41990 RepID=A0AA38R4I3_9PEZI|nr:hypothetical protein NKR23_g9558 [Pleurostoma richardsiae]